MNIEMLRHPTDDDWMRCKICTLVTVGKEAKQPPTQEWKHKLLKAQHSPIRELEFTYQLNDIPYWVSVHLTRHHVGYQPYVKTQRNDRQDEYDRNKASQDAPVDMIITLNAESLITLAKKRLCAQASKETREIVRAMCLMAEDVCPEFAGLLQPACVWQNGTCHELKPCGKYPPSHL